MTGIPNTYRLYPDTKTNIGIVLSILEGKSMPGDNFKVFVYNKDNVTQAFLGWEYEPPGNLDIIKTTKNNNGEVGGFQFRVTRPDGTSIVTDKTDDTGIIEILNLKPGLYIVEEINLSNEFVKPSQNPVEVEIKSGETAKVSFENIRKMGRIKIEDKTGNVLVGTDTSAVKIGENEFTQYTPRYEDLPLSGAVFEIWNRNDITTFNGKTVLIEAGTKVGEITTLDGKAESADLPLGDYYLIKIEPPYGMVLDTTVHDFTLK